MRLSHAPIVLDDLLAQVTAPERGGTCVFVGTVRNDRGVHGVVTAIEYRAYDAMAEGELERIVAEVREGHPETCVAVRHRLGRVELGATSVAVAAAAPHRAEAFTVCRRVIEDVKHRVPIWKRELYADGTGTWIDQQGRAVSVPQAPR